MRHIYNCEQISIPRAVSSNDMSDLSSQHIIMTSDTRNSSFDDSIPTPTVKGQFDFSSNARFVHVLCRFIVISKIIFQILKLYFI
jgi:hypothetical protein